MPVWLGGSSPSDHATRALATMLRALQAATESALESEVREVYITTLLPVGKRLDDRLRRDLWTLIHCMLRLGMRLFARWMGWRFCFPSRALVTEVYVTKEPVSRASISFGHKTRMTTVYTRYSCSQTIDVSTKIRLPATNAQPRALSPLDERGLSAQYRMPCIKPGLASDSSNDEVPLLTW